MSDSRLEKFIYAICSMDVSDLPVPLSRIEKLWNCLITGETPDYEPLSRNEKYLMAMLDRYDISNLPAPMSRGEKLLYKIAVGETDLSDIPGYLSRYEELLKYLIENGGISGSDFEYVLHTLNQSLNTLYLTAAKPVKSAILKGQTLVNLCNNVAFSKIDAQDGFWEEIPNALRVNIIKDKKYFIRANVETNSFIDGGQSLRLKNEAGEVQWTILNLNQKQGLVSGNFTAEINGTIVQALSESFSNTGSLVIKEIIIIEYQDGIENWDIPYFEGMQSVKMPVLTTTGKNLFPTSTTLRTNTELGDTGELIYGGGLVTEEYIPLTFFEQCIFSSKAAWLRIAFYDIDKNFISLNTSYSDIKVIFTPPSGAKFFRVSSGNGGGARTPNELQYQIEKGTIPTSYEPYKSNVLTVNEDVTLRGIGEVKDELNLMTGEYVQRIGEIILDGSDIVYTNNNAYMTEVSTAILTSNFYNFSIYRPIMCKDFPVYSNDEGIWEKGKGIVSGVSFVSPSWGFCVRLPHTLTGVTTVDSEDAVMQKFKAYLQSNPITIQYHFETPTIKTVDLTVVDQDNQPTELGTFKNVTHVSLEAENLIPEVEMEVATRISEELASASPLMDDISTKQEHLNITIDEQSNNVDATMIATTEIFEETL